MTVPARDAATIMLVRDSDDGSGESAIEVCMLRRNLTAEFSAGAYVFPGGSVDPEDRGPEVESLCDGRTDAEASAALGIGSGGLSFWVAALRECFEEAGVLLAIVQSGLPGRSAAKGLLDLSESTIAGRFAAYREGLNAGSIRMLDICRDEGLRLPAGDVHFVSHWITPEIAPRRFDTRFFVAAAPPGQIARHDEGETIASLWVRPSEALERNRRGEIDLMPPTIANLDAIGRHATAAEVMVWATGVKEVPTVLPIVLMDDGQLVMLCPGDDKYDEALAARRDAGDVPAAVDPEVVVAVRTAWGARFPAGSSVETGLDA